MAAPKPKKTAVSKAAKVWRAGRGGWLCCALPLSAKPGTAAAAAAEHLRLEKWEERQKVKRKPLTWRWAAPSPGALKICLLSVAGRSDGHSVGRKNQRGKPEGRRGTHHSSSPGAALVCVPPSCRHGPCCPLPCLPAWQGGSCRPLLSSESLAPRKCCSSGPRLPPRSLPATQTDLTAHAPRAHACRL